MNKIIIHFLFILVSSSMWFRVAIAQDIGLFAGNSAYVTLDFAGSTSASENRYIGHVTTFDKNRGFLHSKVDGSIANRKTLSLHSSSLQRFENLQAEYERTVLGANTAWVRNEPCGASCIKVLSGTTLQSDQRAAEFLRFYERNPPKRSYSFRDFIAYRKSLETICGIGISTACAAPDDIGIVMEQSQVGAANLVANALGLSTEVATFSSLRVNGAMVAGSAEIASAVFRSTGPELKDDVLNFNDWRIVPASFEQELGLQLINLEISANPRFFDSIMKSPGAISDINSEMIPFFELMFGGNGMCDYDTHNSNPYFDCLVHSSDLDATGSGAWLRAVVAMTAFPTEEHTAVVLYVNISRKYGQKKSGPTAKLSGIKWKNADEAFLAGLVTQRVAGAFRKFFQPNIAVRR